MTAGGVLFICLFVMAIWALVLQAWGWSCNGQGGGGSSPPPSWVRTDSTVLTHSLQLTTLFLSLSLSLCFNFFLPFPLDDAFLPLRITGMHTNLSVHMYPSRRVGVVSIITLYLTFSSANTSVHCNVSFVHLNKTLSHQICSSEAFSLCCTLQMNPNRDETDCYACPYSDMCPDACMCRNSSFSLYCYLTGHVNGEQQMCRCETPILSVNIN